MTEDKGELLSHLAAFSQAVSAAGCEAVLGLRDFRVYVRGAGVDMTFYPRFVRMVDGRKCYSDRFTTDVKRFAGWMPYSGKRWSLASNKLAFKQYAIAHSLLTPAYATTSPATFSTGVVIKAARSSFAAMVQGPFSPDALPALDPAREEYFEAYVPGRIAKVWFWDASPVCMELDAVPQVTGDGRSTILELVSRRLGMSESPQREAAPPWQRAGQMLAYHGRSWNDVLDPDQTQTIEFRYASRLHDPRDRQVHDLRIAAPVGLTSDLREIGRLVWQGIPAEIRDGTVYTVDGVVDGRGAFWALEMNSNPFMHPWVYSMMIDDVIGGRSTTSPAAEGALS